MARTREEFYKEGYTNAVNPQLRNLRTDNDWAMPEFGERNSWQSKAFAEGWKDGAAEARAVSVIPATRVVVPKNQKAVRDMMVGFIEAALWAEVDECGEPLENYDHSEKVEELVFDICDRFYSLHCIDLWAYVDLYPSRVATGINPWEAAGHDLYLTSNGHGAGFWDRDMGRLSARLYKACKPIPGIDFYVDRETMKVEAA